MKSPTARLIPTLPSILSCVILLSISFLYELSLTGCRPQVNATLAATTRPPATPLVSPTPTTRPQRQADPTTTATCTPTTTRLPPTATASPLPPAATATKRLPTPTMTHAATPQATRTPRTSPQPAEASSTPRITAQASPTNQKALAISPTPTGISAVGYEINPLTGLKVSADKLNRRPLGIKIPNFPIEARPQSGLSLADVVIEHEAEAYLTRFTAIFLGNDVNSEVGPVRSLRLVDGELMPIFKSTLVASGGHPQVKIRITQDKAWAAAYKRIICPEEPFLGDGGTMRRVAKPGRRYELTLYSDTASLWSLSTQRGTNQRQDFGDMWTFSEFAPPGGTGATHLKIVYKPSYSEAEYRYDAQSHTYERFDLGQATTDALTGQQIAPSNVVVLYANHVNSDILADQHDPDHPWYAITIQLWGEGQAKLMRDGQVYDCKWVRQNPQQPNDRLVILDRAGRQVPFRPGPTWIQIVRPDGNVQID